MDRACVELIFETLSLLFIVIGGGFALIQWRKTVIYKRTEIVRDLISDIRGNDTIATVMDIIDWNQDFEYDGSFSIKENALRRSLQSITDDKLMQMIDYTLSRFTYVCYLKEVRTIDRKDMLFFEYEIRRLMDNTHISNYLYSLFHWSNALGVQMSFSYLISYGIKKGYLHKSFCIYQTDHPQYHCFLRIPNKNISSISV